MPAGFLYVLINPSMPGLAKVGKTTRDPADRVSELSSATGVPSPFILAFQQPVVECDTAELWVHNELERNGYRIADNREFFSAPLHEIIPVIVQAASLVVVGCQPDGTEPTSIGDEIDPQALAEELFNLGVAYQYGTSTVLRNSRKALEYYEQAAACGHRDACTHAGVLYQIGEEGIRPDAKKALEFYSKAVRLGAWWDEGHIARLFTKAGQVEGVQAHWTAFFESAHEAVKSMPDEHRETLLIRIGNGSRYFTDVVEGKIAHCVPDSLIETLAEHLLDSFDALISDVSHWPDKDTAEFVKGDLLRARRFVEGKIREA